MLELALAQELELMDCEWDMLARISRVLPQLTEDAQDGYHKFRDRFDDWEMTCDDDTPVEKPNIECYIGLLYEIAGQCPDPRRRAVYDQAIAKLMAPKVISYGFYARGNSFLIQ